MNEHNENHLDGLGGAAHLIITNSDHVRDSERILLFTGAKCWGPFAEKEQFPFYCDDWLKDGDKPVNNIEVYCMDGSKTIIQHNKTPTTCSISRIIERLNKNK